MAIHPNHLGGADSHAFSILEHRFVAHRLNNTPAPCCLQNTCTDSFHSGLLILSPICAELRACLRIQVSSQQQKNNKDAVSYRHTVAPLVCVNRFNLTPFAFVVNFPRFRFYEPRHCPFVTLNHCKHCTAFFALFHSAPFFVASST